MYMCCSKWKRAGTIILFVFVLMMMSDIFWKVCRTFPCSAFWLWAHPLWYHILKREKISIGVFDGCLYWKEIKWKLQSSTKLLKQHWVIPKRIGSWITQVVGKKVIGANSGISGAFRPAAPVWGAINRGLYTVVKINSIGKSLIDEVKQQSG